MTVDRKSFWPEFLYLNLVNLLVLGGGSGSIILPVYLERGGLARWEIGLVGAGFYLAAVALRLRLGGWMVCHGQLPFYRAGALVIAACETSYSFAPTYAPLMLLLRSVEGMAMASYFTAVWARVIDSAPGGRISRITGLFGISGLFAGAVGPWAWEQVARTMDYPSAFRSAGLAAFLGLLLTLALREIPRHPQAAKQERGFAAALLDPAMATVVLSSLLFGVTQGSFNTFIAPYAQWLHLAGVGQMFLFHTTASISVRLTLGGTSDRHHPARIIVPALLVFSWAMLILAYLGQHPSMTTLILAGLLVGAAHGLIFPAISTLALQRAGASSNTSSSVFTACMDVGALSGAIFSGLLSHHSSYPTTFASLALLLMLGAFTAAWLERPTKAAELCIDRAAKQE